MKKKEYKIALAYEFKINIDSKWAKDFIKKYKKKAEKAIEVVISFDGQTKEMTLEEFKNKIFN